MGDTSETNTKVLSRELFLGVVALKRLYRKIIICATRTLFSGTVTYIYIYYIPPPLTVHFSMTRSVRYQHIYYTPYITRYTLSMRIVLLHLVIVKYGDISLVLCISTRLRLVTILSLLVKYLVIFHADPCNKSYI